MMNSFFVIFDDFFKLFVFRKQQDQLLLAFLNLLWLPIVHFHKKFDICQLVLRNQPP